MGLALDNSASAGYFSSVSSGSLSYAVSGSNTFLVLALTTKGDTNLPSSVTYNGVGMTKVASETIAGGGQTTLYYLVGPTTGTHNAVITFSSAETQFCFAVASYNGAKQSGQPDSSANTNTTGSSWSVSTTVVAANCWLIGLGASQAGKGLNANQTVRQLVDDSTIGDAALVLSDSNGTVGTGSQSMGWTTSGSTIIAGIVISVAPVPSTAWSQTCTESAALTDKLSRATSRIFTQSLSLTDVLAAGRLKFQTLAESLALSDTLSRITARTLAETTVMTDYLSRLTGRVLAETLTMSDSLRRAITRVLAEVVGLLDICRKYLNGLLAMYSNKYDRQNTAYTDKNSPQGTTYTDKYQHLQ